jgi:DNA repair exonuclease
MLRFIHCADLHFDRPFEGLHLIAKEMKKFARANEQVLENIVTLALNQQVDFVLLAGDTFHQNRPTLKTQHQFFQQMQRLQAQNIPVYMIFGNHDYFEKERYWFEFPENVHLFEEEEVNTILGENKQGEHYAISGFSYCHPWITTSKVSEFPERQANYHIGMYHGDAQGEHYAPFQLSEMKRKGYDYWALGHIHVPTELSSQPPIIYPGAPQGHTQKETTAHTVQLVEIQGGKVSLEPQRVSVMEWREERISLKSIRTSQMALEEILASFEQSEPVLMKLTLVDSEQLPKNWLSEKEKTEMIMYLNDTLARKGYQQLIHQITVEEPVEESFVLSGKAIAEQLLNSYQETTVFNEMIDELLSQSLVKQTISLPQLQATTLARVSDAITHEFRWSEEER